MGERQHHLPGLRGFNPGLTPTAVPDAISELVMDRLLEAAPPSLVDFVVFFARVVVPVPLTLLEAVIGAVDADPSLPPDTLPNLPRFKILDGVATGIIGCCWFE